jgi:hypothetical protein
MKLKFIKDAYYNGQRKYIAENTYDIPDDLGEATRWLKRGLAEEVGHVEAPVKEEIVVVQEEVPELTVEEIIVKEELKKENGKVKRKKGSPVNENPEVL